MSWPSVVEGARPVPWPYGRDQQFAAGRCAAAAALASAGSAVRVVARETGGRPAFPPGYAGSIAHTDRLAVAVVVPGASGVGVDIEDAEISARVTRFVLREEERRALLGHYTARELFAAKEAAFKAMNDDGLLFWRIGLEQAGGTLIASHRGEAVPVWVRTEIGLTKAVAIRGKGSQ
jgi:4'-phosphopantetheinyl transferase EntD